MGRTRGQSRTECARTQSDVHMSPCVAHLRPVKGSTLVSISCNPIPNFDPVLFGPHQTFGWTWWPEAVAIRWYAMAYIVGLVLAFVYALWMRRNTHLWVAEGAPPPKHPAFSRDDIDELLFLATIGVILGGRLGYVLFYMGETNPGWFGEDPLRAIKIWEGGMSFHGGLLGVGAAIWWLARSRAMPALRIADLAAVATPVGLLLGRLANFINGELYGRAWDGPWAVDFPCGRQYVDVPLPRHPSQLYEAALEGAVLLAIQFVVMRYFRGLSRPGLHTGIFLAGYAAFRSFVELFRQPDTVGNTGMSIAQPFGLTMGQFLSVPMFLGGVALVVWALRQPAMREAGMHGAGQEPGGKAKP